MMSQTSLGKIESGRPKLLSGKNSITIYVLAVREKSNYDVQNYCLGKIELGRPKILFREKQYHNLRINCAGKIEL